MFTGLIQGQGRLEALAPGANETRFTVRPLFDLPDIVVGESIAVNGVCLTVERDLGGAFTAYVSGETLSRTTLGSLSRGGKVNLERALALGDRLGGHMVSGHVDCLAEVASVTPAGASRIYRLGFDKAYAAQVVEKGSVALDGISLTVNECGPDFLTVNIIPETQQVTTIAAWRAGTRVNMETDIIGKYVERMLSPHARQGARPGRGAQGLGNDFFRRHGY